MHIKHLLSLAGPTALYVLITIGLYLLNRDVRLVALIPMLHTYLYLFVRSAAFLYILGAGALLFIKRKKLALAMASGASLVLLSQQFVPPPKINTEVFWDQVESVFHNYDLIQLQDLVESHSRTNGLLTRDSIMTYLSEHAMKGPIFGGQAGYYRVYPSTEGNILEVLWSFYPFQVGLLVGDSETRLNESRGPVQIQATHIQGIYYYSRPGR
jgi:hypothetical protein